MTARSMPGSSPSRVMTRSSRSTVRYASCCRTAGSRMASTSSRAVASRMVPSRWRTPAGPTNPRGRVKVTSVRMASLHRPLEACVHDRDALECELVVVGVEAGAGVLRRPAVQELPRRDRLARDVDQGDLAVHARGLRALLHEALPPLPQLAGG